MSKQIICNVCGRQLSERNGILQEDALFIKKDWGYFSDKDLEIHQIIVCENCYDQWTESFPVPVQKLEKTEVLSR